MNKLASSGADVIGLDWTMDLAKARAAVNGKVALQGNMDPTVLYGTNEKIKEEVERTLNAYGKHNGHIFNLGHGILPDIEPDHAKALSIMLKN